MLLVFIFVEDLLGFKCVLVVCFDACWYVFEEFYLKLNSFWFKTLPKPMSPFEQRKTNGVIS